MIAAVIPPSCKPSPAPIWIRPGSRVEVAAELAEPAFKPRFWRAFATHDGGPCTIYRGFWPTTFRLGMEYQRQFGGRIHFVEDQP